MLANYTTTYGFDLVGNRIKKATDELSDSSIDEIVSYDYDNNNRLTSDETRDGANTLIRSTDYEYGSSSNPSTQQTKKTELEVSSGITKVTDSTYNLQGRLSKVEIDETNNGSTETTIDYEYNDNGIRVTRIEDGTKTRLLIDANNHTGYQQILEAWEDLNNDGIRQSNEKLTSYLLGHDILSQWTQADGVLVMLYDGHGSNRGLVDAMGIPLSGQIFAYDAYGNRLDTNNALTVVQYSGEMLDVLTGNYNNRARIYNPVTGRFNRVDPYAGNINDPQSLHKYLYTHGDPVNGIDPTGLISLSEISFSIKTIAIEFGKQGAIVTAGFSVAGAGVYQQFFDGNFIQGGLVGAQIGASLSYSYTLNGGGKKGWEAVGETVLAGLLTATNKMLAVSIGRSINETQESWARPRMAQDFIEGFASGVWADTFGQFVKLHSGIEDYEHVKLAVASFGFSVSTQATKEFGLWLSGEKTLGAGAEAVFYDAIPAWLQGRALDTALKNDGESPAFVRKATTSTLTQLYFHAANTIIKAFFD